MDDWKTAIGKGMLPGALASVASAAVLALRGKQEAGHVFAGHNAISHWLWGDKAFRKDAPTWKYTLVGYGIHHASSLMWASLFEQAAGKVLDRKSPGATLAASAAATAVACFVDYQMTPKRLRPGFEERVSRSSLALVYTAFGLGLAAGALLNHRDKDQA
ncbi:hypothetical protein [Duganella sp.]|uniref:hypothetical protein n=1 Tax=Duganella sp. TaxID=1904440 RepID=UPI0031D44CA2